VIPSKKIPFDYNHPVAVATRKLLDPVNTLNARHDFWGYKWNIYIRDFDGDYRHYAKFLTAKFFDDFTTYGRMHTDTADGYQTCREIERRVFFIDNLLCDELDYQCCAPRIAYNLAGHPCPDDCYVFLGEGDHARLVAKKVLNIAFNATSEMNAVHSFRRQKDYSKFLPCSQKFNNAASLNRAWLSLGKPDPLKLFDAA
jgi:hypothetical protein